MGDRTYCQLRLIGEVPQELMDVIEYELSPEDDYEGIYGIQDVNYGRMPSEVFNCLRKHKVSAIWMHDSGAEYGQGFELYDGKTDTWEDYRRDGFDITGRITDLKDQFWVEDASQWQEWINTNLSVGGF